MDGPLHGQGGEGQQGFQEVLHLRLAHSEFRGHLQVRPAAGPVLTRDGKGKHCSLTVYEARGSQMTSVM